MTNQDKFDKKRLERDMKILARKPIKKNYNQLHKNSARLGRNEECFCGSGLKYKKCCLPKSQKRWQELMTLRHERTYNVGKRIKKTTLPN